MRIKREKNSRDPGFAYSFKRKLQNLMDSGEKKRKRVTRAGMVLAGAIAFTTTYALILPAVTLDGTPQCGKEEHVHTEACYSDISLSEASAEQMEQSLLTTEGQDFAASAQPIRSEGGASVENPEVTSLADDPDAASILPVEPMRSESDALMRIPDAASLADDPDAASILPVESTQSESDASMEKPEAVRPSDDPDAASILPVESTQSESDASMEKPEAVRPSDDPDADSGADGETKKERHLICGLEEHQHSRECYPGSDAQTSASDLDGAADRGTVLDFFRTERHRTAQVSDTSISAEYDKGVLPDTVSMKARAVDSEDYSDLIEEVTGKEDATIKAFDISFRDGSKEVEPDGTVEMTFKADFIDEKTTPEVIHITDDGHAERIPADIADGKITLTAESSSVYAIVYTVDFEYEIDGKTYQFGLPGGGAVSLTDIVETLGMLEGTQFESIDKFLGKVADVSFSNPELVSVSRAEEDTTAGAIKDALGLTCEYSVDLTEEEIAEINTTNVTAGDWVLISLKAFETEESLTITMKNGDVVTVTVTDAQHVDELALLLESAAVYENGNLISWPVSVRENKFYDIRLTFKENNVYQFLDTGEEMYYPVPEGLDLGDADFEHEFSMDVGDGMKLEGNTVKYDAATKRFTIHWNTNDKTAFNKLIASNSAEFRLDFKAKFDFTKDNIEFSENVSGKVIRDTSFDVDVTKTGEYNHDQERIDYTVTVMSYGEAVSKDGKPAVVVKDELFGTALTYIRTGENHGVNWKSSLDGAEEHTDNAITLPAAGEQPENGFIVNVGHMDDGEILTFTYSAKVDYEKLTGPGTYDETFNKVVVTTPTGEKEKDHSFTNDLHYVELDKNHTTPVNWNGDLATIDWKVTVNENPKVSLGGSSVSDRIYAGDVEGMDYSGSGLHIRVYKKGEPINEETGEAPTVFVGEYDVPWEDSAITRTSFDIRPGEGENAEDEIQYASWIYTIPETQIGTNNGETVMINNKERLWYEITYTTDADKSLMNFEGYIGNEAQEHKTGTEMQDGFYPPGTGTMPEVKKEVEPKEASEFNAPKGSNEQYIYWTITFDRQKYDLTRCVIEDNSPVQWGHREPVDVTKSAEGDYEYLYVEGLKENETWEVTSATDPRTTIKFYRDKAKTKPGLGKAAASYDGENGNPSNTITIHLRTRNNETWLKNTLTNYWPKNHTNTVTWICNAHQVEDDATATPDVRKIMKEGIQVGTIVRDDVSLPVFRYELFLTGIDADSFKNGDLVINDVFDTSKLELIRPDELVNEANGFEYTQALKENIGNYRIQQHWDQKLKGYSTTWKGPVDVTTSNYDGGDGQKGLTFTVTKEAMEARGLETVTDNEGKESQEYCLRYSLPYYLVVKDAEAAQAIAKEAIDARKEKVEFTNTATWTGENPLTDSTTVEAGFKPAQKSIQYNDQRDLATYQLTLNPQGLKLNNGQMIRVEDAYENLAVDFSTLNITTVPEDRKSQINWSYHNNKGVFWIPDETVVIITYEAQPIGDAGKNVTIKNELTMLKWNETVEKTVTLNSESEGSAGDYNIRLFKYKDDFMNEPLSGAVFQLFEAGDGASGDVKKDGKWYRPVKYATAANVNEGDEAYTHTAADIKADDVFLKNLRIKDESGKDTSDVFPTRLHHKKDDNVYFSTGVNGYSDIHLSQSRDGLALERGRQYYLYEVVTPAGYEKEDIYWSFIIDDMDFFDAAHGIYQYRDGGVLTVSNESSQDRGIVISKSFTGDARDAIDWNQVQFEIVGVDKDNNEVYKRDVSFEDFVKYKLKLPNLPAGSEPYTYTITEKNADVATATRTTSASVIKTSAGNIDTDGKPVQTTVVEKSILNSSTGSEVSFQVTDDDLNSETAFKVAFENNYVEKPVELTLNKEWGTEAQNLANKSVILALYKDGVEYNLYKDGDVYKPVALSKADPKPDAQRIVLNETTGWTVKVADLPRYENGKSINWTIREVGATYTQDGVTHTVTEADMDMQFNITAKQQTGLDEGNNPVYKTVKVEKAEAKIDTTSAEKANLTLNNEKSKMTTVKVEKKWYDKDGELDTTKTDDDAVTYDLYRTKEELPKGGKERRLFAITNDDGHPGETDLLTNYVEALPGDKINIHIVPGKEGSLPNGGTWNGQNNYNFAGVFTHVKGIILETGRTAWNYPLEVVKITGYDGTKTDDLTNTRGSHSRQFGYNQSDQAVYVDGISNWSNKYKYIDLQVKMTEEYYDVIDRFDSDGHPWLWLRNWLWATISVSNLTQESENLTHAKLEQFLAEHSQTTELYRENLTLGELENEIAKWDSTSNYPEGYTYFAIEHTPAQYSDTYSIVDTKDDKGNVTGQVITIENRPVELEEGQELGTLTVQKVVKGLPDTQENRDKTFQFRIKNGSKYLVKTGMDGGKPIYKLMSLAEMTRHNPALTLENDATCTIKAGEGNKLTFGGLYPAIYTIEEVGDTRVTGFTLETTYSGNGRVGVNLDQTSNATITNTYTPEETQAVFGKIWADGDNKPVVWPEDQSIEVVVHRRVGDDEDSSFALTYTITKGNATLNTAANKSKMPDPELVSNAELKVIADDAVSPYYAYRYELSGVSKVVLTGEHAGEEWVYYVTETVPRDAIYESGYGLLNGTAVNVVTGKTSAEAKPKADMTETDYILNKLSAKEISFTKKWFDGVSKTALNSWPKKEKAKELDSEGNVANPDAPAEYEDVPISVTLRRTLEYKEGVFTKETEYDSNFAVSFNNLTSSVTAREQNTAEGKLTLTMAKNGSNFTYTISGLKEKGTLDGQTGTWKYYIVESAVDGYATTYQLNTGKTSGGIFTDEGGSILNTKKLGTIVVEKKVQGLPESEKNKTFSITVKNSENRYLKRDGTIVERDSDAAIQLKAGEKAVFQNVPAGSYMVEEPGTESNGSAQVYGYSLASSIDDNGAVSIVDDDVKNVTVTNTYTKETTEFSFTKVWYGADESSATDWMTDFITVTLNRSFALEGKKTVNGDPVTMVIYPTDGNSGYDYTVRKVTDPSTSYAITIKDLERWVPKEKLPEGTESGEWTYTLAESVPSGYYARYFMKDTLDYQGAESIDNGGKIENHQSVAELPSTGGIGTRFFTIFGSMLIVLSGAMLIMRRRRERS